MQKVKTILNSLLLLVFLTMPGFVMAADYGMKATADQAGIKDNTSGGDVATLIGKYAGVLLSFVGAIFFLLMVYAGVTWMMAQGNEKEVQKAKDTMQAAVIGLILVLSAYAITSFIGTNVIAN